MALAAKAWGKAFPSEWDALSEEDQAYMLAAYQNERAMQAVDADDQARAMRRRMRKQGRKGKS